MGFPVSVDRYEEFRWGCNDVTKGRVSGRALRMSRESQEVSFPVSIDGYGYGYGYGRAKWDWILKNCAGVALGSVLDELDCD